MTAFSERHRSLSFVRFRSFSLSVSLALLPPPPLFPLASVLNVSRLSQVCSLFVFVRVLPLTACLRLAYLSRLPVLSSFRPLPRSRPRPLQLGLSVPSCMWVYAQVVENLHLSFPTGIHDADVVSQLDVHLYLLALHKTEVGSGTPRRLRPRPRPRPDPYLPPLLPFPTRDGRHTRW